MCGKCSFVTVFVGNFSKHKRTRIKQSGKDKGCAKDLTDGKLEESEIITSLSVKLENESPNISNSINSVRDRNETETKKDVTDGFPKKSSADNVRSLNLGNVNMNCRVELKKCPDLKNFKVNSENFGDDDDNEEIKGSHNRHKQSKMDNSLNNYEVVKRTKNGTSTIIFKSLQCPYTTNFRYKIVNHYMTHKMNKNYNCLDCNFKAKCLFLLKNHRKTHVENNFECYIINHAEITHYSNTNSKVLVSIGLQNYAKRLQYVEQLIIVTCVFLRPKVRTVIKNIKIFTSKEF
ncbi:UNVERIFIED_CONTAM: hypothetical protein RMT77_015965 [Armadillidium vulgare]